MAIIDSGVYASHPHVQGVASGVGIDVSGAEHGDYIDRLGHGTAVTAVIKEKAPSAELLIIKVFDRELKTSSDALVSAIRWAVIEDASLISLSLGTTNPEHEAALREAVNAADAAGVVIVAAAAQAGVRWLPGALPAVIAVQLDWALTRDVCRVTFEADDVVRLCASGYPRPIPGVAPENNLKGISFAVANATGFIARLLEEDGPSRDLPTTIRRALQRAAVTE